MFDYKENMLKDTWSLQGNDLDELKEVIEAMTKATTFEKWKSADISLLSLIRTSKENIAKKDGTTEEDVDLVDSIYLNPNFLPSENLGLTLDANIKKYRQPKKHPEIIDEWQNKTKLALIYTNKKGSQIFYFTSGNTLQTLDRFGMSGDFLQTPCLERDMMIAKRFQEDLGITAVVRTVGKVRKVFTILSDKYTHINQKILFEIIEKIKNSTEMKNPTCYKWEVSNFFTRLFIEFPDKAHELSKLYGLSKEMIPGVVITTSDTGDSSFTVCGTWRTAGSSSIAINSEVKRKHIGNIDINKIVDEISKTIFAEYAKLPEALCNLMSQDITDSSWNLGTSAGVQANQAMLDKVLKNAFKRLNIVKAIGKKAEKTLRQAMLDELNPSVRYTAYDICMMIMGMPERVVFMDKNKDIGLLQKTCSNAPFIDYTTDSSVILTA